MPKESITKGVLIAQVKNAEQLKRDNHILYRANRQFLKYFLERNPTLIETTQKELDEINEKYCQKDEKGKFVANEKGLLQLKDPAQEQEYYKEYVELCQQVVQVNYL